VAGIVVGVLLVAGCFCGWLLVIKGLLTLPCIKKPEPAPQGPPMVVVTQPAAWGELRGAQQPQPQGGYAYGAAPPPPPPPYAVPPPPGTVMTMQRMN